MKRKSRISKCEILIIILRDNDKFQLFLFDEFSNANTLDIS